MATASIKAEIRAPPLERLYCTVEVVFTAVDDSQESTSNVSLETTTNCTVAIRPSTSAVNLDEHEKSCVFYKEELVPTFDPIAKVLEVPSSSSGEVSEVEEPAPETPETPELSLSDFEYVALDQQQQEDEEEEEEDEVFEELFEPDEEEAEPSWCQRVWPWCSMVIVCCFVFLLATTPDGPNVYSKRYSKMARNNNEQYRRVPT